VVCWNASGRVSERVSERVQGWEVEVECLRMVEFLLLGMFGWGYWCICEEGFETGGFVLKVLECRVSVCVGVRIAGWCRGPRWLETYQASFTGWFAVLLFLLLFDLGWWEIINDFSIFFFFVGVDGVRRSCRAVDVDGSFYVVHRAVASIVAIIEIEIDGCHCSSKTVVLGLRHFRPAEFGGRANDYCVGWQEGKDV